MQYCKKRNFIWIVFLLTIVLFGCSRKEESMAIPHAIKEDYNLTVITGVQVRNKNFFPPYCKSVAITTDFTFLDNSNLQDITKANLLINELDSYVNGILYELKIDIEGDSRFHLGYFYVTSDKIYRFTDKTQLNNIQSPEDIIEISSIVSQSMEYEDSLADDEKGWHEYLEKLENGRMAYHRYSNFTETGFYECLIFEKNKGLVGYYCGYGAQKDAFEITVNNTIHTVKFAGEPFAYVEETEYYDRGEYIFYDKDMNPWLYGSLYYMTNGKYSDKFKFYLYNTDGTLLQTLESYDWAGREFFPHFLDANMDGYMDIYFSSYNDESYLYLWDERNQHFVEPIDNIELLGSLGFRGRILYIYYGKNRLIYKWDGFQLKELEDLTYIANEILPIPEAITENGKIYLYDENFAATKINAALDEKYNKWEQQGYLIHSEILSYNYYNLSVLHRISKEENGAIKEYYYASNFNTSTGEKLTFSPFCGTDLKTIKDMLSVCLKDYETDFLSDYVIDDNFIYDGKYLYFIFNEGTVLKEQSILMLWDKDYIECGTRFLKCDSQPDGGLNLCVFNEAKTNENTAYDMYNDFLNGKIPVYSYSDGKEHYINEWMKYTVLKNYVFYDMNSDGIAELHVCTDDRYLIIGASKDRLFLWEDTMGYMNKDMIRMPGIFNGETGIFEVFQRSDGTQSYYFYRFYDFGVMQRCYSTLDWYDKSKSEEGMDEEDVFYLNGANVSMEEWLKEEELYKNVLSQPFEWEKLNELPYKKH